MTKNKTKKQTDGNIHREREIYLSDCSFGGAPLPSPHLSPHSSKSSSSRSLAMKDGLFTLALRWCCCC